MLFALMLGVFVMQIIPKHQVTVGVMSGLPYGKKIAPVPLACKSWWQLLLWPLEAEMKQLWTGMVFTRPHVGTSRLELRGRVRVALVKDVWYLQCTDIDKKWFVNVRAPLESTEWRTCYTCPANGTNVPPSTSDSKWVSATSRGRAADNENPLKVEYNSVVPWFAARKGSQKGASPMGQLQGPALIGPAIVRALAEKKTKR